MAVVDLDELAAAGLYEPGAPDAAQRADLLAYLLDAGISVDDVAERSRSGDNLTSLLFDRRLTRGEVSAVQLAERTGTPLPDVVETYRLLGVPVADVRALSFDAREPRLLELVAHARAFLPEGMADEVLRSVGQALADVSEAKVAAFLGSAEDLLQRETPRTRAELTTATGEIALELGSLLEPLLRHHLWAAVQRQRTALRTSVDRLDSLLSIGFVDLVGFTAATESMDSRALLGFVQEFHQRTFDVVSRLGGRVVKHIGDEVMYSSPDPDAGCAIALGVVDAFDDVGSVPRGGLAHGLVVARHGDCYGSVVNLAARLTDAAVPGEVLADAAVARAASNRFAFEPAGRRQLKGFAEPVTVVAVRPA